MVYFESFVLANTDAIVRFSYIIVLCIIVLCIGFNSNLK